MKRKTTTLTLLCICLLFCASCSAQSGSKKDQAILTPDSSVSKLLGDTICNILFSPQSVSLFLSKAEAVTDTTAPNKLRYDIEKKLGRAKTDHVTIMQFLLSDIKNYDLSDTEPKCLFFPYLALKFKNKSGEVTILISYNCHKWAFEYNNQRYEYKFNCYKQILQLSQLMVPNDEYFRVLAKYETH